MTMCFAAIGECMLELSHQGQQSFHMDVAGDTYNVCVYLARASDLTQIDVQYITAIGTDRYSQMMQSKWVKAGIKAQYTRHLSNRLPGLYIIELDDRGERYFTYYRDQSAARAFFQDLDIDSFKRQLASLDYLFFSGISVAIFSDTDREILLDCIASARAAGCRICFDNNYRAQLWRCNNEARLWLDRAYQLTDIALPSYDDECELHGSLTQLDCAKRIHQLGVTEVVLKQSSQGYLLSTNEQQQWIAVTPVSHIVDTTGAGDSFDGTYIAGRITGLDPIAAAKQAQAVAAQVIQHKGAIIKS